MVFIYNIVFILILGFLFRNKLNTAKGRKTYLFLCFFQMAIIQGLRDVSVGTDTALYVNTFNNYLNHEFYSFQFQHYELFFRIFFDFVKFLGCNYHVLLLLISMMTMFGFAYFIYKNSNNVILSTFLFACLLYPNSFNIMRQYLAVAIAINSYSFIKENKMIKAILLIVFSSFFHKISLLLLLFIPLKYIKNFKSRIFILIAFSFVFFIFGDDLVPFVLKLFGGSYYIDKYLVHRLFRLTTMVMFVFWIFIEYFNKQAIHKKNDSNETSDLCDLNFFANIALLNFMFGLCYLRYEYASRFIEIFNSFLLLSLPFGLQLDCLKHKKIISSFIYVIPFLLMLNAVFNSGSGVSNYRFFFMN